jgi:hypothetical protein
MANQFDSLIIKLQHLVNKLSTSSRNLSEQLTSLIPAGKTPPELNAKDVITAFKSQDIYTNSIPSLLDSLSQSPNIPGTLETLTTATNIVQIYFQITQPLEEILPELVPNLEGLPSPPTQAIITSIKEKINKLIEDRKNLQKEQNKILREFEGDIDEEKLQDLLQGSSDILAELQGFTPTSANLEQLLLDTGDFVTHLQKAQELFKTFSHQGEAIRDSEAGEVEQLIRNWRDAIKEVERLELNDDTKEQLNKLPDKSRQAIAQSIQIHELLETNYGFLSDLIRSGDLVSPGVL